MIAAMMKLAAENHLLTEDRLKLGVLPSEMFPEENLILNPKMGRKKRLTAYKKALSISCVVFVLDLSPRQEALVESSIQRNTSKTAAQ